MVGGIIIANFVEFVNVSMESGKIHVVNAERANIERDYVENAALGIANTIEEKVNVEIVELDIASMDIGSFNARNVGVFMIGTLCIALNAKI